MSTNTTTSNSNASNNHQGVREFQDLNTSNIIDFLNKNQTPFSQSILYSVVEQKNIHDEDIRKSTYRIIDYCTDNATLFAEVDVLLQAMSEVDKEFDFHVRRGHCGHIVYKEGDFFKRHTDFISVHSNVIREFTLIVNVQENQVGTTTSVCQGGETLFHVTGNAEPITLYSSTATITPGSAVLFDKSVPHESVPIERGEKHVLTCDVWATRKEWDRFLVVSFVNVDDKITFVKRSRSYIIPFAYIEAHPKSMLAGFLRFNSASDSENKIMIYECTLATFEQFSLIYRIYFSTNSDKKVGGYTIEELSNNHKLLDAFGLIGNDRIMECAASAGKEVDKNVTDDLLSDNSDIIICNTAARVKVLLDTSKQFGCSYIPFKAIFTLENPKKKDDLSNYELALLTCGEYNNIYGLCTHRWYPERLEVLKKDKDYFRNEIEVKQRGDKYANTTFYFSSCSKTWYVNRKRHPRDEIENTSDDQVTAKNNNEDTYEEEFEDGEEEEDDGDEEDEYDDDYDDNRAEFYGGLLVATVDPSSVGFYHGFLETEFEGRNFPFPSNEVTYLPSVKATSISDDSVSAFKSQYFHLDADNKIAFTMSEANATCAYIQQTNFIARMIEVAKCSPDCKTWSVENVHYHCNEENYSSMCCLEFNGVFKFNDV